MPEEWQAVWEPGLSRYYFWNTITDEVSWLPPDHPKAKISLSVPKLKAMVKEQEILANSESDESKSDSESLDSDSDSDLSSPNQSESEKDYQKGRKKFSNYKSSFKLVNYEKISKKNDLDPMDPAAYSDTCPRGKWSDGLEKKVENKKEFE